MKDQMTPKHKLKLLQQQIKLDIKRLSSDVSNNDYICDLRDYLRTIEGED